MTLPLQIYGQNTLLPAKFVDGARLDALRNARQRGRVLAPHTVGRDGGVRRDDKGLALARSPWDVERGEEKSKEGSGVGAQE